MRALSELSDQELIALSNADHQDAFACLLGRYSSMIHAKAVAKSKLCACDVDDLSQEAAIGFLKAVRSYDAAKGAGFRTYAEICVENVLVSAVRAYLSRGNLPLNDHREFADTEMLGGMAAFASPESTGDPEGHIFESEGVGRLTETIFAVLTEREKAVIQCRIKGFSYEETAKRLGISVKSVDNAIQRVRQKMKSMNVD